MTTILFRTAKQAVRGNIIKKFISKSTLHSSILQNSEFKDALCQVAIGKASQKDILKLQAKSLVKCFVESKIKEESLLKFVNVNVSEVVNVKVDRIELSDSSIRYSATGTWVSLGEHQKVFSGQITIAEHSLLRVLIPK